MPMHSLLICLSQWSFLSWLRVDRYAISHPTFPCQAPLALATGSAVLAGALRPVRQTRWCQLPVLMLCRPPVVVAELAAMEALLQG